MEHPMDKDIPVCSNQVPWVTNIGGLKISKTKQNKQKRRKQKQNK